MDRAPSERQHRRFHLPIFAVLVPALRNETQLAENRQLVNGAADFWGIIDPHFSLQAGEFGWAPVQQSPRR